jgi:transcription antitermination factor NusG
MLRYWAVVQTQSQREHIVRLLLMRLGCETYMPRIKHRGRIAPLFPSYVFVRIIDRWYPVRWIPYVIRLIMAGEQPAPVPETFMNEIRKRERNGFVQLPLPFKTGQKVRISKGSFAGHIGIYAGMTGKQRETILLELLGQTVQVELRTGNLRLVV